MREALIVNGIVLSASPVGDYDKRLVILTKERGKITAFARGARRPKSSLLAVANPFVFGSFSLYEGRSAYTLVQAEIRNYFMELAGEQPGIYYGFYFLEVADYYSQEGMDGTELLNLLYVSLRALLNPKLDDRLVRRIFELRALVIYGVYPQMFSCVCCGKEEPLPYLSVMESGVLCPDCAGQAPDLRRISSGVCYTMQYIIGISMEKLYLFTVSDEILQELGKIMDAYLHVHLDRKFKSLEILEVFV